jgi:hypothetical protein
MKLKPFCRSRSWKNGRAIVRIKRTEMTGRELTWQNGATIKVEARAMVRDPGIYLNWRREQVIQTAFGALIAYAE